MRLVNDFRRLDDIACQGARCFESEDVPGGMGNAAYFSYPLGAGNEMTRSATSGESRKKKAPFPYRR